MFNPKRTALYLAIGAMALAAGEASAGCKVISGSTVCASWIKGSEVCDITSSGFDELVSATCSVTGVNFVDGAEGASGTDGAYCASGELPPGLCTPAESAFAASFSSSSSISAKHKAEKKKKKPKKCKPKPKHHGKHDGKGHGHDDFCVDLVVPGGDPYLSEEASTPVCGAPDINGVVECTASAEIFPPEGSTCSNGEPAGDFTASEMLAIVEACVDTGYGEVCGKIYEYCTVNPTDPDGTAYDCVDITDQGERCSISGGDFLTYDPDDPLCGTPRSCED